METISPTIIALGGGEMNIRLADGAEETVKVRLFKLAEFPDYLRLLESEEALAEFACQKEPGWAATVDLDSVLDIVEKVHDLNFSRARRWGERRAKINEALLPIAVQGQKFHAALGNSVPTPHSSSGAA